MCGGSVFIQAGGSLSGVITNSDVSCSAMILEFEAATVSSERWEVAESQVHMNVCLAVEQIHLQLSTVFFLIIGVLKF